MRGISKYLHPTAPPTDEKLSNIYPRHQSNNPQASFRSASAIIALARYDAVMVVSNGDGDAHGLHASRFNNHLSLGSNQEQALPSQISVRCRCIAGFKWRTDTVISDCVWGGLAAESRDYATSTPSVGCADRFPRTACTRTLWDCIARLAGPKFGRVACQERLRRSELNEYYSRRENVVRQEFARI